MQPIFKQRNNIRRPTWQYWSLGFLFLLGSIFIHIEGASYSAQPDKTTLVVAAATSLQESLKAIDPLLANAYPDIEVRYNFAASGVLRQQIEQGAPMDVFISAAPQPLDALQAKNLLLAGSRRNLLTNRLVLIVPKNSNLNLGDFRDLASPKVQRISMGEPRSVPVGHYALIVLTRLKILTPVQSKLVFANNARAVIAAVASGNVDAGIVYLTDVKTDRQIRQVALASENLHPPIIYPIAVLKASKHTQAAKTYANFLTRPIAQAIFQRFGFGIR